MKLEGDCAGTRVLVIEDDVDTAESMRELLTLGGHSVDVAGNGPAAVERARQFRPDVVLCDIRLPEPMSGYDVARALRQDGRCLIALTGYGEESELRQAYQAGFDLHFRKPIDPAELLRVIRDLRGA